MHLTTNQKAFLDMIAISELGPDLLKVSDNGYNVLVGSTAAKPLLFGSYAKHPNVLNERFKSTAAGRYQLLFRWWGPYQKLLNLPDFGHDSQDAIALQQIKERKALPDIEAGDIESAITKCANIWASFTGAGYGQHEHPMDYLLLAFVSSGGSRNV